MKTPDTQGHIAFLFSYMLKHKLSYGLGIVFIFLTNWLAVNIPENIGASIDLLKQGLEQNQSQLDKYIFIVIAFALLMIVTRTISRILFFNPGRAIEKELKDDAFSKLTLLQQKFYSKHQPGQLISIINNDINGVRALAGVVVLQVFNIIFALSLTPLKMWQLSPHLTLYCLVPVMVTFFISHKAIKRMRDNMKQRMVELQTLSSNTVGFLSGIEVIKAHQIYGWATNEFAKDNQTLLNRSIILTKIRTLILPILGYTDRIMRVLILAVGGAYVIQSTLSLGDMVAFLSYATLLALPFFSLSIILSSLQNGVVSIASMRRILDQQPDEQDQLHLPPTQRDNLFSAGISVKNLSFTYPDSSEPTLKNISFEVRPGQKIGVLGQVGSGKTTLVNCLNRYLDVEPNHIFIDNHDITQLSRKDLRSAVRTLTQEPFLFSDSVSNNIRFSAGSDETLSLDEVLYQSDMLEEVQQFPEGVDTLVGEKGILLSGGQKQRLSLARALYTPCKLIILDNVLSAVDNETERFLLTQIFDNMRSQSSLIVSHRASVLERVDLVLVLDNGEIVAQGTHKELLKSSDIYRKTWQLQQQESDDINASQGGRV